MEKRAGWRAKVLLILVVSLSSTDLVRFVFVSTQMLMSTRCCLVSESLHRESAHVSACLNQNHHNQLCMCFPALDDNG